MNRLRADTNKYDIFVIVLIAALAGGEFGGALQLSRAAGLLFSPLLITAMSKVNYSLLKGPRTIVSIILGWCFLSLIWTGNFERGLQECVYYIVHFLVFFEIIVFSYLSKNRLRSISTGWALAVFITAFIALWEYNTGQHLQYSRYDEDLVLYTGYVRRFAAATFFNFNDYEVFLCYSLPFLFVAINQERKMKELLFFFFSLFAAIIIILFNASRGATIAAAIISIAGFFKVTKMHGKKYGIVIFAMAAIFITILFFNIDLILQNLMGRIESGAVLENERLGIWTLALRCLENTYFFGTGIAGVESGMSVVSNYYLAPHNMFIEMLIEFGVLIFTVFIIGLWKLFIIANNKKNAFRGILIALFLALPFISIVSSKYLLCVDLYVFWGSFYVVVNNEKYSQSIYKTIRKAV